MGREDAVQLPGDAESLPPGQRVGQSRNPFIVSFFLFAGDAHADAVSVLTVCLREINCKGKRKRRVAEAAGTRKIRVASLRKQTVRL